MELAVIYKHSLSKQVQLTSTVDALMRFTRPPLPQKKDCTHDGLSGKTEHVMKENEFIFITVTSCK